MVLITALGFGCAVAFLVWLLTYRLNVPPVRAVGAVAFALVVLLYLVLHTGVEKQANEGFLAPHSTSTFDLGENPGHAAGVLLVPDERLAEESSAQERDARPQP